MKRPNILWISLEDTSPRFGCYGDMVARTPNIDRLASQGCRFPNAFSTAGVCAPSRSAIITGMYQTAIGTHHMRTAHTNVELPQLPTPYEAVPPHYVKCFPEYLRAAGYFCTNNEKTDYQFAPPFTAWDQCDKTGHWRNRPDADQPFFAVFNPTVTHESHMWPREDETIQTDPAQVILPPYLPDTLKSRAALARHYDNLARADEIVGRILQELEDDGLAENTIVFLWSDHGEGLPRAKRWPYDAGIRVPLLVRWPNGLEAGSVREDLVSLLDLGPTVLSLCSVQIPRHCQGQAFIGPHAGEKRSYIFAARDRHDVAYDMVRAVRDGRFKYIRHFCPEQPYIPYIPYANRHPMMQELWRLHLENKLEGAQRLLFSPRPAEELYDTQADPHEIDNLAHNAAHRETLERMRNTLNEWRTRFGDKGEISETEMVEQMWPNHQQPATAPPIFIPITSAQPGLEAINAGTFAGPLMVQLQSATQGASIGYTFDLGDSPRWQLYSQPLRLAQGTTTLRAKAIRIGYRESEASSATFTVNLDA